MQPRVIPYGLEKDVTIERTSGTVTLAVTDDKQGYVLLGGDHAVVPEQGKRYRMMFCSGPSGGYWRITGEAGLMPPPPPPQLCGKLRYPDKKAAQTAINSRTTGRQRQRRHRPERDQLRAYPCHVCHGWHITHKEYDNDRN